MGDAMDPEVSQADRTWALLAHASGFVLAFIPAIVIMLTRGKESAFVRDQAVEALNFQITVLLAAVASMILTVVLIGFLLIFVVVVGAIVLVIMAAVAAYRGERYRYPWALRLVH